jgi:hypothetical protein
MAEQAGDVRVPSSLQALLAARLDGLEPAERAVLERGAVEGEIFHRGGVQALAAGETQVTTRLAALVRRQLIQTDQAQLVGDDGYRFRHLLIRDAAYEALPKATRAELHERFADWLEQNAPQLVELDEILGYHLEQAYAYRSELGPLDDAARALAPRAAERVLVAAKRAFDRGDLSSAESLTPRSAALATPGSATHREALLQHSRVLLAASDAAAAEEALKEVLAAAELAGDARIYNRARLVGLELDVEHDRTASMESALVQAEEAGSELARLGDDEGVAWALRVAGTHTAWLGRSAEGERRFARAFEHATRAGSSGQIAEILMWRAWVLWWSLTPADEGIRQLNEIIEQAAGHPQLEAIATIVRGLLTGLRGNIDEGREAIRAGRARLRDIGHLGNWAGTGMIEADLELAAGQPAAAEAVLRESYEFMSPTAETGYIATIVDYRAVAALEQRRDDEALAFADEVERLAQPEDFEPHVRQACVRARVLARRGDHDAAAKTIQAAVARGGECDYFTVLAYAAISLAEVERLAGRLDPERRALDEALDLCKQKGDLLTAARVREQLAELSSVASP